ncbi:hypothetical protein EPO17_03475 [Patescibacteria group bacterium]|nr:MAG: hypothetical protein EPO17_03475 [Patescibacteria group bacterium]
MSVEFEDEQNEARVLYSRFMPSNQLPKLVGWVIKAGIVKNENQANYFLIGLAVFAFLASFYFFGNLITGNTQPNPQDFFQNKT